MLVDIMIINDTNCDVFFTNTLSHSQIQICFIHVGEQYITDPNKILVIYIL